MENWQDDAGRDGRTHLDREKNIFSVQLNTSEQDWQSCPVIHTLLEVMALQTYFTNNGCGTKEANKNGSMVMPAKVAPVTMELP